MRQPSPEVHVFLCCNDAKGLPLGVCSRFEVPALGLRVVGPFPCEVVPGLLRLGRCRLVAEPVPEQVPCAWAAVQLTRTGTVQLLQEAQRLGGQVEEGATEAKSAWRGEVGWQAVLACLLPPSEEAWELN